MTKADYRKIFRRRAADEGLPPAAMLARTLQAADAVRRLARAIPAWMNARHPCVYSAIAGEMPTAGLLVECLERMAPVALPRVAGDELALHIVTGGDKLQRGAFGILEPVADLPQADPAQIDCIVVPGVAFDATGGRVGRGRGYYDRLLARIPATAPRIALAWEWQVFERVPLEPHDLRMDFIITPERVIDCRANR